MLATMEVIAPAMDDLKPESMKRFNELYKDVAGIKYFSVTSKFDPWPIHIY